MTLIMITGACTLAPDDAAGTGDEGGAVTGACPHCTLYVNIKQTLLPAMSFL